MDRPPRVVVLRHHSADDQIRAAAGTPRQPTGFSTKAIRSPRANIRFQSKADPDTSSTPWIRAHSTHLVQRNPGRRLKRALRSPGGCRARSARQSGSGGRPPAGRCQRGRRAGQ
jgi:hypothetical protein